MRIAFLLHPTVCALVGVAFMMAVGCDRLGGNRSAGDATVIGLVAPSSPISEAVDLPNRYRAGQAVYVRKCALCHDRGHEGAPRVANPIQWKKRVGQGRSVLVEHAMHGFEGDRGEMPAQGDDLGIEEVVVAVDYMLYRFEEATLREP